MSGTSVNFDDWKLRSDLAIWELAAIILGVDPRALADVIVNNGGDPLDLSFQINAMISAVAHDVLKPVEGQGLPSQTTKVHMPSAIDWLRSTGHKRIARQLSTSVHPHDAPISKKNDIVKRLRHVWNDVEEDIKRAKDNGLFEEAAAPKSGYWYEGAVIAWAKTNGRLRDPASSGTTNLTNAWNSGLTSV